MTIDIITRTNTSLETGRVWVDYVFKTQYKLDEPPHWSMPHSRADVTAVLKRLAKVHDSPESKQVYKDITEKWNQLHRYQR